MTSLFEPGAIGSMIVPNRIVRSATHEGMAGVDGAVTSRFVECMSRLAAGEVGLIITGHMYVRADGRAHPGQAGIHDDRVVPSLRCAVERVHGQGARIVAQISHAGAMAGPLVPPLVPVAPSAVADPCYRQIPRALGEDELPDLVRAFVDGAVRAKSAGFDGVQVHAAHGYLLSEFLSPRRNRRTDGYGGSSPARSRIVREVCTAIRDAVGARFPILVKMNGDDLVEGGLDHEGALEVATRLADAGIDAVEVSGGVLQRPPATIFRTGIDGPDEEGYFQAFARAVEARVSIPVISVGGYRTPQVIDRVLASGIDFVSMSRPFIREPDLVRRWRSGDDRRAACTSCNRCLRTAASEAGLRCPVQDEAAAGAGAP